MVNAWTSEAVARFWNHPGGSPPDDAYFSRQVGAGIVHMLRLTGNLGGEALDYGCGRGWLVEELLAAGVQCTGVDTSATAIAAARERIGDHPALGDLVCIRDPPAPLADGSFDVVACVETVEHVLSDADLDGLLGELRRLVRPGGVVVVTTPDSEDLAEHFAYCPFCDTQFHRMQHTRSFTPATLAAALERNGLSPELCRGVNLNALQEVARPPSLPRWRHVSFFHIYNRVRLRLLRRSKRPLDYPGHHLVAIARR